MSTGREGGTHALVSGVDGEWLPLLSLVWLTGVGGLVEVAEEAASRNKGTSTFNTAVGTESTEVAAVGDVVEGAERYC